jgi:hypothetical protein
MADDAEKPGQLNHLKVRRWKIAIPVAVVGAIAAPFVFGTWKMPQCRTQRIVGPLRRLLGTTGGEYQYLYLSTPKYFALNFAVAFGAFIAVFSLTFLLPGLSRR